MPPHAEPPEISSPPAALSGGQTSILTVGMGHGEREDFERGLRNAQARLAAHGIRWCWQVSHRDCQPNDLHALGTRHYIEDVMIVVPYLPTWSRLPCLNSSGPKPLRSRAWPWGLPWMNCSRQRQAERDNGVLRQVMRAMQLFLGQTREGSLPNLLLLMPEDLGAVKRIYPASPWQLAELRCMAREFTLQRSSFYQCTLGPSQYARPTGILHSFRLPSGTVRRGWPRHKMTAAGERYDGPLPSHCECGQNHDTMTKTGDHFQTPTYALSAATSEWLAEGLAMLAAESVSEARIFHRKGEHHGSTGLSQPVCADRADGFDSDDTYLNSLTSDQESNPHCEQEQDFELEADMRAEDHVINPISMDHAINPIAINLVDDEAPHIPPGATDIEEDTIPINVDHHVVYARNSADHVNGPLENLTPRHFTGPGNLTKEEKTGGGEEDKVQAKRTAGK